MPALPLAEIALTQRSLAAAQVLAFARQRDAALDALVHDTGRLTAWERDLLAERPPAPGVPMVVQPGGAGLGIRVPGAPDEIGTMPRHLAAGGLTALGAAALARGLADFTGEPVLAVAAGPEGSHLAEALWAPVAFGAFARARTALARLAGPAAAGPAAGLIDALLHGEAPFLILLAHGPGAPALAHGAQRAASARAPGPRARLSRAQIVTLGAPVALPAGPRAAQFLGALDAAGALNAHPGAPHERVPGAGHHLNPRLPFHLDLHALLERVFTG